MGNWWNWELGISRSVNNTLVILYDDLPSTLIDKYNLATRHFVRDPRYLAEGSGAPYSTTKMPLRRLAETALTAQWSFLFGVSWLTILEKLALQ